MGTTTRSILVMLFALLFIERLELMSCSSSSSINVSCIESEREALIKFRDTLRDYTFRLSSWVGKDCCTWEGVGCSKRRNGHGHHVHVVTLDLHNPIPSDSRESFSNRLRGEINPSLLSLKHLHHLDLSNNDFFTKQIPDFLFSLKSLRYLDLSSSFFSGSIPRHLGNLSRLQYLNLSDNYYLVGPIPDTIGTLTSLTVLDLSRNHFDSSIPYSFWNLCSLRVLDLSNNKFRGNFSTPFGSCILRHNSSLKELNLDSNKFSGYLPNQLGEFKNLEYLSVSGNSFYGPLPPSLGRLSYLRVLDARNNHLNGNIPSSLGQLSNLEYLDLSNNSLVGLVSEPHFAKLESLNALFLSSNSFVLNVSSQWVPPFQLQIIEMASCKLGPQFPLWLQTQKSVERLNIANASISDTIPYWFENLYSHIRTLDLSNNQIRGKLPNFKKCKNSHGLNRKLILSYNKFEGPLTPLPSDASLIDLSNNLLSGPISMSDYNLTLVFDSLVLSNNHLTGGIPASLCKAVHIMIIDLSKNQLSGRIPRCLGDLHSLWVLDLKNNNLHGRIPSSLGSLPLLLSLHLRNNSFHGKLPSSLQNLTSIVTLDLGDNVFSGIIPHWMGDRFPDLKFLNLQSNNFYGDIPPQLCGLFSLRLLNLAHNNMTGNIRRCFSRFTGMVELGPGEKSYVDKELGRGHYEELARRHYEDNIVSSMKGRQLEYTKTLKFLISIDLSNNGIAGEIPKELMDLSGLRSLNLSGNHLEGRIPEMISNLKQLESLDLSGNKLFGPIPPSLSTLSCISHLNLSFNNLSGPIPTGNQLQTLDDYSFYIGNDGLCGAPLPKSCSGDKSNDGDHEYVGDSKGGDDTELLWFYAGIGPGFSVGFLGVCGTLHFNKSWRHAYFQFIENRYNRISVAIAVRAAWLRRKFHRGKFGG